MVQRKNQTYRRAVAVGAILLCFTLFLSGCVGAAATPGDDKLHIVATTTMLADLARAVGGDAVAVTGLMGPGIDPHLYQASAGDVQKLQKADVVIYNGLHLEGKMGDIFAQLEGVGKTVICIEAGMDQAKLLTTADNAELYDPHIWFDVALWKDAAAYTAERLAEADPDNAGIYRAGAEAYLAQLDGLDAYIRERAAQLPADQRVMVTAHDAFRYFGVAYGFEVRGLQGISTGAEAGTADVSKLADFIAERQIKAIFVESSVPPRHLEALQAAVRARGFEVAIGGELYSDSLGDAQSACDTYILTFRANIDTLVDALLTGGQ